jgi:hypothetical protein
MKHSLAIAVLLASSLAYADDLPSQPMTSSDDGRVDDSMLDADNSFDCVRLGIASPGSNADLICVVYILSHARYPNAVSATPSAIVD